MLAYVLDGFYHQCNDICICSIEGICYTQTSYYALVNLVPFCEHGQCYVYAAPTVTELYTPLKMENNTIYHQPNLDNTSVDTAYNKSSAAFIIDSNGYCPNLCIRGEDGKFYEPLNDNDDFYVQFLPFCDDYGCHMYAAVYEDKGDPLKLKNGPTIHMPNTYKRSVGTNTTYLKAAAVSCFTCAEIKNEYAFGPTVSREQKLLLPYPTLYYNANGTNLTLIDVLEEDIVGDAPGVAYSVITEFCKMAWKGFNPSWV
uniref:Uncharacterized protein n=1 Tax=Acrobeloides nanus TaxID=290746 RepID=A0A914DM47_9BILA